ncbi:MAG: N-6 DNA methylase, partial [Bacteroidota bacterium]|nr:N-6 DNA methylase [Bacteroidota bacterium]
SLKLSTYDFNTDVDVNILGHIFEHSLSEIEEMEAELSAPAREDIPLSMPISVSKRKKDGVYYTPKYITQYIVENTIGTLCTEKRKEMQIYEIEFDETHRKKTKVSATRGHIPLSKKGEKLFNTLNDYKNWLKTLKILDPACGSGAFLNQALNFLIAEHKLIDDLIAELTSDTTDGLTRRLRLFDTDKSILENNLYGVDINEESVEIAKLSLWLRTAQKGRKLSDLSGNIKCGNSLIDDPEIAGDKAFDWEKEFPHVFNPQVKEKVYQKLPETKPDYLSLIEKNAKLAAEKAEQSVKFSKEAIKYSKKVNEYVQEQKTIVSEAEVVYGLKKQGGFDVILGNPPYVSANNMSFSDREYFNKFSNYKTLKGKWDLYIPFIEKSLILLKQNGFLSFIVPYGFLNQPFGIELRQNILNNNTLYSIVDLHDSKVFKTATVPSCIPIIRKGKNTEKNEVDIYLLKIEEMQSDFSIPIKKYHTTEQNMFRTENVLFFESIINKVKTVKKGKLLGDIVYIST